MYVPCFNISAKCFQVCCVYSNDYSRYWCFLYYFSLTCMLLLSFISGYSSFAYIPYKTFISHVEYLFCLIDSIKLTDFNMFQFYICIHFGFLLNILTFSHLLSILRQSFFFYFSYLISYWCIIFLLFKAHCFLFFY